MRISCKGCYWQNECGEGRGCDEYTPLNEYSDYEAALLIEANRFFYTLEWAEYVRQTDDTAFEGLAEMRRRRGI